MLQQVLIILGMTYVCLFAQVIIHCNVHNSLFSGSKVWNRRVGTVLCWTQLQSFMGYKVVHFRHHRYANTPRDPHYVDRPLLPYILTHYPRISQSYWLGWRVLWNELKWAPLCAAAFMLVCAANGLAREGVVWTLSYWLIPVIGGHVLLAHFNWWGHVNMDRGRGRDTRSGYRGIWRVINFFTLNFYLHAEHHLRPGQAAPIPESDRKFEFGLSGRAGNSGD